jgi:hypothetical protein
MYSKGKKVLRFHDQTIERLGMLDPQPQRPYQVLHGHTDLGTWHSKPTLDTTFEDLHAFGYISTRTMNVFKYNGNFKVLRDIFDYQNEMGHKFWLRGLGTLGMKELNTLRWILKYPRPTVKRRPSWDARRTERTS